LFRALYISYMQLNYPERRVHGLIEDSVALLKQIIVRFISRFLLIAYALLMFKPAMPIVNDFIAHTFRKAAHLKVVHRVNGKTHVHYELCKAAKDGEPQKNTGKVKIEHVDEANLTQSSPILFAQISFVVPIYVDVLRPIPDAYSAPDFLPPKA